MSGDAGKPAEDGATVVSQPWWELIPMRLPEGEASESGERKSPLPAAGSPARPSAPPARQSGAQRTKPVSGSFTAKREETKFLNLNDAAFFGDAPRQDLPGLTKLACTVTANGETASPSVVTISQKQIVVRANGASFPAGTMCSVRLEYRNVLVSLQASVLTAAKDGELKLYIPELTRAQLTSLVLLINELGKPLVVRRPHALRRLAAFVALGVAGAAGGYMLTRPSPKPVTVTHASFDSMPNVLRGKAAGDIAPRERVVVRSAAAAPRPFKALVKVGERVTKGQVVARGEDTELVAAVGQAKQRLSGALYAMQTLEKRRAEGAEPDEDATKQLRSNIDNARATVVQRESELARLTVVAPIAGLVTVVNADGGVVSPSGQLLEVADDESFRVAVPFVESDAQAIAVGMGVSLEVPGIAQAVMGTVQIVDPIAQNTADGRVVNVQVSIPRDARLRIGGSAAASIDIGRRDHVLTLPASAILSGAPRVVVLSGGKAVYTAVELGTRAGARVEVRKGVDERSDVVAAPAEIADGQLLVAR